MTDALLLTLDTSRERRVAPKRFSTSWSLLLLQTSSRRDGADRHRNDVTESDRRSPSPGPRSVTPSIEAPLNTIAPTSKRPSTHRGLDDRASLA